MKSYPLSMARLAYVALALSLLMALVSPAWARGGGGGGDMKLEAQLIWGTNDKKSPDPKHKAIDEKVAKKLKKLPFKWENYYEVTRITFKVPKDQASKVDLSKECSIKVRYVGKDTVELLLYGKNELVSKITQVLTKDEMLVTGGNAANLTAWFVVLCQVD
jgi:hypothetical protein